MLLTIRTKLISWWKIQPITWFLTYSSSL